MTHRYITNDATNAAISPISAAVVAGDTCYVSGQIATDPRTGTFAPGTTTEEAKRAFANLMEVVESAGFTRADVVYVDLAFLDLTDLPDANAVFASVFPEGHRLARTVYQAAGLPLGARIKVQGIAVRQEE